MMFAKFKNNSRISLHNLPTIMLILLLLSFLLIKLNQAKCSSGCSEAISLYEDLLCKPIYENPSRFYPVEYNCSHILNIPKTECLLQGRFYKINELVPRSVTLGSCQIDCSCSDAKTSSFACIPIDCAEVMYRYHPLQYCTLTYQLDSCCSVGQICQPFNNLTKCEFNGETYYEGEKFQSPSDQCSSCVCQKGFTGEFVEPFCKRKPCLTELHSSAKIQNNCAAVFLSENNCCPIDFICPGNPTFTIEKAKAVTGADGVTYHRRPTCKFGQKLLNVGDRFVKNKNRKKHGHYVQIETECVCRIPPLVTCIQRTLYT